MTQQIQTFEFRPNSFEQAMKLANIISKSDLAPKAYKNKPENTFIAIQMGGELGLLPMQSIQNIDVINGRPCLYGDAPLALVQSHPAYEWIKETYSGEGMERKAVCVIKRKNADPHTATFSVADAKRANLWGKVGSWTTYPDRMLQMRARGFALRNTFADALKGIQVAEEVRDIPVSSGKIEVVTVAEPTESPQAMMLEKLRLCENEEELQEVFKTIHHHANYTKDSELIQEATQIKDEMKAAFFLDADDTQEPENADN